MKLQEKLMKLKVKVNELRIRFDFIEPTFRRLVKKGDNIFDKAPKNWRIHSRSLVKLA